MTHTPRHVCERYASASFRNCDCVPRDARSILRRARIWALFGISLVGSRGYAHQPFVRFGFILLSPALRIRSVITSSQKYRSIHDRRPHNDAYAAIEIKAKVAPGSGERIEVGVITIVSGTVMINGRLISVGADTLIDNSDDEFKNGAKVICDLTDDGAPALSGAASAEGSTAAPMRATRIQVVNALYQVRLPVVGMQ
jgi:hypothetical protein